MGRPRNTKPSVIVEVSVPRKLVDYIDELKDMEGFGASRSEIVRNFVWQEVNRLIEVGMIKQSPRCRNG